MEKHYEELGLYRSKSSGTEWVAYRNTTGHIELFRTTGYNEDGSKKNMERVVTLATTLDEVDEYFQKAKRVKYNPHHSNQLKIE